MNLVNFQETFFLPFLILFKMSPSSETVYHLFFKLSPTGEMVFSVFYGVSKWCNFFRIFFYMSPNGEIFYNVLKQFGLYFCVRQL